MRRRLFAVAVIACMLPVPPARAEGDAARGQKLFARCSACHSMTGENRIGPSLAGVFGRPAGKAEGARYSRAMTSSNIIWDEVSIDAYLAAPAKFLPGTTMAIGMPNAGERADIVAYLRSIPSL